MDMTSIDAQDDAGVHPDYGLLWVGVWNLRHGWGGPDQQLDAAYQKNVTPVIEFYYWGDDISRSCIEDGCHSSLHDYDKNRTGWQDLARQLADHVNARMHGRPVVIVLETEFNKADVATYEPLDGYLADKADYLRGRISNLQLVLGLGNWGSSSWGTWDRAMAKVDAAGLQALAGSTRQDAAQYHAVVNRTLAGAQRLQDLFQKGVLLHDLALSSYTEPDWSRAQDDVVREVFARKDELKAAGLTGVVYRAWEDNPNMDTANYYGEAERWWGLAHSDGTSKPALASWLQGVRAERAPLPLVTRADVGRQEAEQFEDRTAGAAQSDGTASGGQMWGLWSNGSLGQRFDVQAAGVLEVRVAARGTTYAGVGPHMVVTLEGQPVLEADPGANWTVYRAWVRANAGQPLLRVAFTNDARGGGEDRNLLLDKAAVEWMGTIPPSSDATTRRVEAEDFQGPGAGARLLDKAASGGLAWQLQAGQALSTPLRFEPHRYELRVVARGTGSLEARLDGRAVANASLDSPGYAVLTLPRFPGSTDGSGGDRQLALVPGSALVVDRIALADLGALPADPEVAAGMTASTTSPDSSTPFTLRYTVRNDGGENLALSRVGVSIAGRSAYDRNVALAPGQTHEVTATFRLAVGNYTAQAFGEWGGSRQPLPAEPGRTGTLAITVRPSS
jgi:hypothetical protein